LAIDGTNLYWSEYVSGGPPADGGVPIYTSDVVQTTLVGYNSTKIWSGLGLPQSLAVDATNVYVLVNQFGLYSVPIGGGTVSTLTLGPYGHSVAVTGGTAFFPGGNAGPDWILSVPTIGGIPSMFAGMQFGSLSANVVVTDGTNIYWTDEGSWPTGGSLYAKPVMGGVQTMLYPGPILNGGIAFDTTYVYITTWSGPGSVLKIPKAGGPAVTLATGTSGLGIAVDDTFVYWVNYSGGANSVMRIGK
jgi:hypothetical protein